MSLPLGKKDCRHFWCAHMDCASYSTGVACCRCNVECTCGNCILYSSSDVNRPVECMQRREDIQRGYAYAVDIDY